MIPITTTQLATGAGVYLALIALCVWGLYELRETEWLCTIAPDVEN